MEKLKKDIINELEIKIEDLEKRADDLCLKAYAEIEKVDNISFLLMKEKIVLINNQVSMRTSHTDIILKMFTTILTVYLSTVVALLSLNNILPVNLGKIIDVSKSIMLFLIPGIFFTLFYRFFVVRYYIKYCDRIDSAFDAIRKDKVDKLRGDILKEVTSLKEKSDEVSNKLRNIQN